MWARSLVAADQLTLGFQPDQSINRAYELHWFSFGGGRLDFAFGTFEYLKTPGASQGWFRYALGCEPLFPPGLALEPKYRVNIAGATIGYIHYIPFIRSASDIELVQLTGSFKFSTALSACCVAIAAKLVLIRWGNSNKRF
jgi:hypothetical protein